MAERIVIISDLHLGRPRGAARSAEALRPVWANATRLVVNGDAAEVHHPRHWAKAARETLHLFDLCERDDVELTLLSGNHDPYLTDLRHLHIANGAVFVTHGDVMHPAIAPWSPAAARVRSAHDAALAALAPEERGALEARLAAAQHAGFAEWRNMKALQSEAGGSSRRAMLLRPWTLVAVLAYWRVFPRLVAAFVEEHAPEAAFAVTGHTHRPGLWHIGGRTIVNTGSFGFPGRPWAVVITGDRLAVHRIRRRRRRYVLAPRPVAAFALPSDQPAPDPSDVQNGNRWTTASPGSPSAVTRST